MIETKQLRKVFGPIEAVKGVSFRVEKGEVLGFLGPNGAGKSTVMRMLTCFLTPTSGTATVGGHDILNNSMAVRRLIGYLPESNPLYTDMEVQGFLQFIGEMRGFSGAELKKRVDKAIEMCWLTNVRRQMIETLSKGYQRRVGLAQTLLHDPQVLVLDEPTDGLDPNQKYEVRSLIQGMAAEKSIIISTHILEEVEHICTRAIIIANGRILEDNTPDALTARSKSHGAVILTMAGKVDIAALENLTNVKSVEKMDAENGLQRVHVFPKLGQVISHDVLGLVAEKGWKLEGLHVETGDLNEVFREITTKEGARS
ncbi:TPA: ABC transporter ATP-binding protein [Candidatus Sumerlaeota bacterium]|nr:ABC transporter ATP-binding protein [Candidatus Sumerlaeota bacterium]